jgi:hypothetical protein
MGLVDCFVTSFLAMTVHKKMSCNQTGTTFYNQNGHCEEARVFGTTKQSYSFVIFALEVILCH